MKSFENVLIIWGFLMHNEIYFSSVVWATLSYYTDVHVIIFCLSVCSMSTTKLVIFQHGRIRLSNTLRPESRCCPSLYLLTLSGSLPQWHNRCTQFSFSWSLKHILRRFTLLYNSIFIVYTWNNFCLGIQFLQVYIQYESTTFSVG